MSSIRTLYEMLMSYLKPNIILHQLDFELIIPMYILTPMSLQSMHTFEQQFFRSFMHRCEHHFLYISYSHYSFLLYCYVFNIRFLLTYHCYLSRQRPWQTSSYCCLMASSHYPNSLTGLTNHWCTFLAFTWTQFHRKYSRYLSLLWVQIEYYQFKIIATFPRTQWVECNDILSDLVGQWHLIIKKKTLEITTRQWGIK